VGIKQFWVQRPKTQQYERSRRLADGAEIWPGCVLVNGAGLGRDQPKAVAEFMILPDFRVAKAARLGECPPAQIAPQKMKDFP
jgi:hypothetical protein